MLITEQGPITFFMIYDHSQYFCQIVIYDHSRSKILNDQITIMICDHFADHASLMSNCTESCFPVEGAIYSESSWPRNVKNSEVKRFWNEYMDLSSGKWIQRERDQIQDPIFCRSQDQIFDWTSNFYAEIKIRL